MYLGTKGGGRCSVEVWYVALVYMSGASVCMDGNGQRECSDRSGNK